MEKIFTLLASEYPRELPSVRWHKDILDFDRKRKPHLFDAAGASFSHFFSLISQSLSRSQWRVFEDKEGHRYRQSSISSFQSILPKYSVSQKSPLVYASRLVFDDLHLLCEKGLAFSSLDLQRLEAAYVLVKKYHPGERESGEPYLAHLIGAVFIAILEFGEVSPDAIIGLLLHDIGEDGHKHVAKHLQQEEAKKISSLVLDAVGPYPHHIAYVYAKYGNESHESYQRRIQKNEKHPERFALPVLFVPQTQLSLGRGKGSDGIQNLRTSPVVDQVRRRIEKLRKIVLPNLQELHDREIILLNCQEQVERVLKDKDSEIPQIKKDELLRALSHMKRGLHSHGVL